ncbi:MAG: hypothetical protein Q7K42_06585, partial [Candidatus Diapherotrites archaeon]|nr:hypothetical protein [Candidatus Diapherotrites archaeon]
MAKPRRPGKPQTPEKALTRRGMFAGIGRIFKRSAGAMNEEFHKGRPQPKITRRKVLISAGIGAGLITAHKLGFTGWTARVIPIWLGIKKPYNIMFGFTTHDLLGTNDFVRLIDEAKKKGKPFHYIFFESRGRKTSDRINFEKRVSDRLSEIKKIYEEQLAVYGRGAAKITAMDLIREKFSEGHGQETTEIYFKAMTEGIKIKVLEFADEETLQKIKQINDEMNASHPKMSGDIILDNLAGAKKAVRQMIEQVRLRNKVIPENLKKIL